MKKLFAMLLALTMTFQLITPAWADAAVEETEEVTEASEVVEEVKPEEDVPEEETTEVTEETLPEETTEATEEQTEATEPTLEELPEEEELTMEEVPEEEVALQSGEDVLASGTCGYNVTWVLTEDGTLTISGTGGMSDYSSSITAPWYKNRKDIVNAVVKSGVTYLSSDAFYGCYKLESATLEEGVRSIGSSAFSGCKKLTSVTIPEGVTSIGVWAFYGCSSLTRVTIPEGVTSIGSGVFSGCSGLTSVTIPEGVTSIGSSAFSDCSGLTSVTIPESVTSIGSSAFSGCIGLTSVTIPEGVMSIGYRTFYCCSGLTSIYIPKRVQTITDGAFGGCYVMRDVYYGGMDTDWTKITIIIENPYESYGDSLRYSTIHYNSTHICEPILVPAKVPDCTETGNNAYYVCQLCQKVYQDERCRTETSLEAEIIPALGHSMGKTAEQAPTCTEGGNLEYYTCSVCGKVFADAKGDQETTVEGRKLPALGHTMTKVEMEIPVCTGEGGWVYYRCETCQKTFADETGTKGLSPEAISSLGHYMVKTDAAAPTCTESGNNAYYTCALCHKVFQDDQGKAETTVQAETLAPLGHSMEQVDAKAAACTESGNDLYFSCKTCGKLYKDYRGRQETDLVQETLAPLGHDMEKTEAKAPTQTVPGNYEYYTCSRCGKVYKDEQGKTETTVEKETYFAAGTCGENVSWLLTVDGTLIISGTGAMEDYSDSNTTPWYKNRKDIVNVVVKSGVTYLGRYAFYGCYKLASATLEPGIKTIGDNAFSGCKKLTSVTLSDGLQRICDYAFSGCSGLTNVTIPAGVTSIGSDAFYGCSGLTSVTIPEGVTSIMDWTFYGCSGLTSVTIPEGVTRIGWNAFYGCSSLTSLTIPAGVTSIGSEAFNGCSGLTSVTIPAGVTSIEFQTFSYCSSLTSVMIPESVTSIEMNAFYGCSSLTSLTVPEGVTSIKDNAFANCDRLTDVYYGGTDYDWQRKDIAGGNECLLNATIHYGMTHKCDLKLVQAKAATCTETGNNAYYYCSICERAYKDLEQTEETTIKAETLPALGHSMITVSEKAPGCTQNGNNRYYICRNCRKAFRDQQGQMETTVGAETRKAFGHTMRMVDAVAPSCTEPGSKAYYVCDTCGKAYKDQNGIQATTPQSEALSPLGHTIIKVDSVASTCTHQGNKTYYTCTACGKAFKDQAGAEATTPEAEALPMVGHIFLKVDSVAPTCVEGGNRTYYVCGTCGKAAKDQNGTQATTPEAEKLPALGHTLVKTEAVAPTCTESGTNAYYTCSTCHKVYKDVDGKTETDVEAEVLAPIGHKMEAVEAKAATCTEAGNHAYYLCANCGKAYLDAKGEKETTVAAETIPALGHSMKETAAVAPTCTTGGNNAYFTCATCHKVYKDAAGKQETTVEAETLAPLGHTMVKTPAVEPTHTSGGNNAYYTCSTCHKVFKDADGKTETTVEAEQLPRLPGLAHGTSGSLSWFLSEDEVLTVSGTGKMPDYSGNDLAPWYTFRGKIQKVVLEDGVQSVGDYAFFDCNMLKEIQVAQSVTKLGKRCLDGCGQLKLLSLEKVPAELTQKVTDLNGLATLAEPIGSLVGNRAAYHWSLETIRGEEQASNLAKLDGSKLEVIHSGKFYLVCEEDYTGLSVAAQVGAKTATEIRPLDAEQLASGESLTLTAWAMPFDTQLSAKWTLTKESEAYASISADGILTAKAVTKPVQVTVKATPVNGEAAAEKTLWILPKTTGLGILADGHLAGETLTVDLTETRELTLTAQIQPQGAGTKVTWSSSQADVATIDSTGKVLLLKPGKTLIRAETQDGSGIAAELSLTVRYLDTAEDLTLTAQLPETGLEPGMTAKLTLSGENAIDPKKVEFYIPASQSAIATVDETGLLTAGITPGTVTVTAALKDDPLMRKAQLTVEVIPLLNHALRLDSNIPEGLGYVDNGTFYGEITGIAGQNRSFTLKPQGQDHQGNWAAVSNVTYASSDPVIATVDASGVVRFTAKDEGTCVITARSTDALAAEAQLTVVLQNSAPRLSDTTVTLNSSSTQGATVGLVASYGNTVDTVTVYDYNKSTKTYALSKQFTAEPEDGILTLYSQGALKNGTYPIKLEVACRTGVYTFTMSVKVANTTPKVTAKQTAKLDLFYKASTAPLTITAPDQTITDVTLTDTKDFTVEPFEDGWELVYTTANAKPDTKGTLNVYLEGYQAPVKVNLTVATVATAPVVKLSAASSTLNTALNSSRTTQVTLLDKAGYPLELENPTVDSSNADVSIDGSLVTITLAEAKTTTVTMYLQDSTWARSVKLTHKVTVSNKMPTLKPAGTLTLNNLFAARTAETAMVLSQSNLTLVNVEATPTAKAGTPAFAESQKLDVTYDPETGCMEASIKDAANKPKAGTYSFNCTGTLETGVTIPGSTLKVTVSAAAPKVKLSATSVKLNKLLAGAEQGTVTVTAPNGYQVVDFAGKSGGMSVDGDTLTVKLQSASDNGGSYTLYPVVRDEDTGEEAQLPTKLSFKVQAYNSKPTVTISAKGKLDTQKDSEITYTVTKLTNCLGAVEDMTLAGQDASLFQADMDFVSGKPTVHLTLVDGVSYATNKAYKVQFRFTACGKEILSQVLTVKVTQTALKVTPPRNVTYYQAQKSPLRVALTTNVPLDEVVLNSKTAKEFQSAVGDVTLNGSRVEFEITNPGALKAGKSYSVVLDATPKNNAQNAKPVTVKLTVKVQK